MKSIHAGTTMSATLDHIRRRLDDARKKLVETSLRNRLINTPLESSRSRSLRCFGELSEQVFEVLVAKKAVMDFRPVPDPEAKPDANEAQEESPDYLASLPLDDATRTSDNALQTRLVATRQESRLKSLYYESREYEEEQGVNVLYLALGFRRWYESPTWDIHRLVRSASERATRLNLAELALSPLPKISRATHQIQLVSQLLCYSRTLRMPTQWRVSRSVWYCS
jgi:hypothetical protein